MTQLVWFRQDLRIADNPALTHACQNGHILPLYILDDQNAGEFKLGAASRVWLHHALHDLNASLDDSLMILSGDPLTLIPTLIRTLNITAVYWNVAFEPWQVQIDTALIQHLKPLNIPTHTFNASTLWHPSTVLKPDKTPYKVFTPFYQRGCLSQPEPNHPLPAPKNIKNRIVKHDSSHPNSLQKVPSNQVIDTLNLLPNHPWADKLTRIWDISESGAHRQFNQFCQNGLNDYKHNRNLPATQGISRLSPYLHFGQISPNHLWHTLNQFPPTSDSDCFKSELAWREFSLYQLTHFPTVTHTPLQPKFEKFPWEPNPELLKKWQTGQTGIPIVDAGMRELYETGFMHNRVRMIVASFLTKNLLIDWKDGAKWFWDCLVDADLANNSASWQWVAGCGLDAAPYFRIFNPILQAEKFDPNGTYIRHYVPELSKLPNTYIAKPWQAPQHILTQAGIQLGTHYPNPIVDLSESRDRALTAYKTLA